MSKKVFLGTSGFMYKDWGKVFYPKNLPLKEELNFFSNYFNSVEINSSFYHLPSAKTFRKWETQVPEDFCFAVKVSRYITHQKFLQSVDDSWQFFLENAKHLGKKLGPFLLQFPPHWKKNKNRLEEFLELIKKTSPEYQYAFEFRHISWFDQEIIDLIKSKKLHITMVIPHSPKWPIPGEAIGDFIYIRMHGGKTLYASEYTENQLKKLAKQIKIFQKQNKPTFIYFNNDVRGYAIKNAQLLQQLLN